MDDLLESLSTIQMAADYRKTLRLLAALKAGTVCLDQVELLSDGWRINSAAAADPPVSIVEEDEAE